MALARVVPEALQRLVDLAVQRDRRRAAEVVEHRRRGVEEERQVVLDAGGGDSGADVLVDPHLGRIALEALAPARAKGVSRRLVHRKLAPGQKAHVGHRVEAPLGVGIEGADRVDLVAEQIDAIRHVRAHREQVDQAAAHRVLARRNDLAHVRVAGERELRLQRRLVEALLGREVERVAGDEAGRCKAYERRRRRHQDDVDVAAADPPERRQPLRDQILVRREGVVRQRLPVGEEGDAQSRREERNLVGEALRIGGLGREDREQRSFGALLLGEASEQQRVGRAGRAGQREALAGGDVGEEHEGGRKSRAARKQSNDFRWHDAPAPTRGLSFGPAAIDRAPMPTPSPNIRRLYAIVPCAGSGVRAGASIAKQYVEVAGRPLVAHTLAALVAVPRLSRILVVVAPEDQHYEGLAGLPVDPRLVLARCGGTTRGATVAGGIAKLAGLGATANDWVVVHDAARCLVRAEWIEALIEACRNDGIGGLLALPVSDTLKKAEGERAVATMSRDDVWQAQTPQMFRFGVLAEALARIRRGDRRSCGGRGDRPSAEARTRLGREHQGHAPGRFRDRRGIARAACRAVA